MATAAQVIKAALQRILVQGSDSDLEPDEYADAMFSMNVLMGELNSRGISLGYTDVDNLADIITVPTGALRGLIANLAVEISPDYNGTISPGLQAAAVQGEDTMYKIGVTMGVSAYPDTLPIGSGNSYQPGWQDAFYPDLEEEILAETTST